MMLDGVMTGGYGQFKKVAQQREQWRSHTLHFNLVKRQRTKEGYRSSYNNVGLFAEQRPGVTQP